MLIFADTKEPVNFWLVPCSHITQNERAKCAARWADRTIEIITDINCPCGEINQQLSTHITGCPMLLREEK